MSKRVKVDKDVPKADLCVVAHCIGHWSEVWLWRQLLGFRYLKPYVLTWKYVNQETFGLENLPMRLLPFDSLAGEDRLLRWFRRVRSLPAGNFYASVGAERRFIKKLLSEMKLRVMLCHFGHAALRMLPVAMELEIPIVAHFHGLDLSSSLNNRWYRWSLLRALDSFNAIVVVGSHQKKWMLQHNVAEHRVHLIPCGVPTEFFRPDWCRRGEGIQFVSVSRLVEGKGLEYSIQAFAHVVRQIPNARLLIVGDGPLRGELEELARSLWLMASVTFVGDVNPEKVRAYLLGSDIFIQHSVNTRAGWVEGFGVSIAEAAACGLPIISTRCGGIQDQVVNGTTGFLVEQRDVDAMADVMMELARDPALRAKFGQAGRERMVREFDTAKQIAKLEAVLLRCCRRTSSSNQI